MLTSRSRSYTLPPSTIIVLYAKRASSSEAVAEAVAEALVLVLEPTAAPVTAVLRVDDTVDVRCLW